MKEEKLHLNRQTALRNSRKSLHHIFFFLQFELFFFFLSNVISKEIRLNGEKGKAGCSASFFFFFKYNTVEQQGNRKGEKKRK